jgi:hypothetical protein
LRRVVLKKYKDEGKGKMKGVEKRREIVKVGIRGGREVR